MREFFVAVVNLSVWWDSFLHVFTFFVFHECITQICFIFYSSAILSLYGNFRALRMPLFWDTFLKSNETLFLGGLSFLFCTWELSPCRILKCYSYSFSTTYSNFLRICVETCLTRLIWILFFKKWRVLIGGGFEANILVQFHNTITVS